MNPIQRHPLRVRSVPAALLAALLLTACGDDGEGGVAERGSAAAIPAPAFSPISDSLLVTGAGTGWPTHGGTLGNHHFSPLDQIDRGNVAELVPVWIHSTGIEGAFETTPLVVDNTMYVTTAAGRVLALNAATGEQLWEYDPEPQTVTLCCGPLNQGVAAYRDMIYVASLDARLIALEASSGTVAWERSLGDPTAGYSATMAPLAVDGRVFVGVSGERYGIRGFIAAFDAQSGEEIWRWHTIPDDSTGWSGEYAATDPFGTPLNRDLTAERSDSLAASGSWNVGGGGIATTPAYDPETDRLFVNIEGPAPMLEGSGRPGDNLYTGSIVALDAATGELQWYTQYLPHDIWGLSGGSPPVLFSRGDSDYVAFAGRTGWVYVFNAANGQPVLRSDNFVPQENLFAEVPEEGGVRVAPGPRGGNAGSPVAYDPRAGHMFIGGVHQPAVLSRNGQGYQQGQLWLGGEARFPPGEEQWGTVTAVDLADGEILWQKRTPAPVHSGVLATAGELVFVGQGQGTVDAFDADSGELLWQFDTGAGVHGSPITYSVGGVQYVVVPAGGSFQFETPAGDDLIAFALASRRPATPGGSYDATDYERGGPAMAGQGGARQVSEDSLARMQADTVAQRVDSGPQGG